MENVNNRKFTVLTFFVLATLFGYVFFRGLTQVLDWFKITNAVTAAVGGYSWKVVGGSFSGLVAFLVFLGVTLNAKTSGFFDDVFGEIRKVTWPSGHDTYRTTIVVCVMVGIAVTGLFLLDNIWNWLFTWLLS